MSFAGLVALARSLNPIPSRTRPLNSSAPMVLCLKTRESRSLPGLPRTTSILHNLKHKHHKTPSSRGGAATLSSASEDRQPNQPGCRANGAEKIIAGWSSPVARQAHNLKVVGSNPAPATKHTALPKRRAFLLVRSPLVADAPSFRPSKRSTGAFCPAPQDQAFNGIASGRCS